MSSNIYIHYGNNKFDKNRFIEIKNNEFVKPIGGLYAQILMLNMVGKIGVKKTTLENVKKKTLLNLN